MRKLPLVLLTLTACSQEPGTTNAADKADTAGANVTLEDVGVDQSDNLAGNEAAAAGNADTTSGNASAEAPRVAAASSIPTAFQGRWGGSVEECASGGFGGSNSLLTITGDRLTFYEARGRVTSVTAQSPGSITVAADYEGEGMTWSKSTRFTLRSDGSRLERRDKDTGNQAWTYIRCPASGRAAQPTMPGAPSGGAKTIPAAFRGRWGETAAACRTRAEDRNGVMTVTSSELHFNKLRAEVTGVTPRSTSRISANLHVREPGRDFTFFTDLVLQDGGKRLVREEEGPRATYIRCPRRSAG